MRMLSGCMHWLTVGLALLVSAQGITTKKASGQAPYGAPMGMMPSGGMPTGGMPGGAMPAGFMTPDAPMSMAFPGPAPGEVVYAGANGSCDSCDSACGGCGTCGDCCGAGGGCGLFGGGSGCGCGGMGCGACMGLGGGNCCLLGDGSAASRLLGRFAPFSEGGCGSPRWFDIYAGTMALSRTSDHGGFQGTQRDPVTGEFFRDSRISSIGVGGPIVLQSSQLDLEDMRFGLEIAARLQLGVASAFEARYFGLNNWNETATVSTAPAGNLFSIFSDFGTNPGPNGFQDTDRSFIQSIGYESELHNGELNFRRQVGSPFCWLQGSILGGVRYFDLDESFRFDATGGATFTFTDIRTFNMITRTRNQMTGFQVGGDAWVSLIPGVSLGVESKGGIFGNHSEAETSTTTTHNAIPTASEFLQDGRTAYLGELVASAVYRLNYSMSVRASYNLLYIDNVALAPENFNVRDISNALGSGAFTPNRFPNLDNDGEVVYQGWSIGGEFMW